MIHKLKAIPLELRQANEFVDKMHRHHGSVHRDKFRIGCEAGGKLVGVVQLARPVSRMLDDGKTIEVVRLCTDGTPNVCSFLYSRAARIAREMGYSKIITYILDSEDGTSLKASGWHKEADTHGHDWSCRTRPRNTTAPVCNKQRWAKKFKFSGGMNFGRLCNPPQNTFHLRGSYVGQEENRKTDRCRKRVGNRSLGTTENRYGER